MSNTTNLCGQLAYQVILEVQKAIIGMEYRIRKVMMAILSGGHVLLEDIPGVVKTTMAPTVCICLLFPQTAKRISVCSDKNPLFGNGTFYNR
ncbi:MAG TPA: hypothetical protein H9858_05320 [Candidatus Blautia stercoravium]|nr:hypothetical protein [Candidatus Blautia stercoravium]